MSRDNAYDAIEDAWMSGEISHAEACEIWEEDFGGDGW